MQRVKKVVAWAEGGMSIPMGGNGHQKQQPSMDWREVPEFMAELRKREGNSARALEFLILTASRTNEVIGAAWDEIDLKSKTWMIPASRMKAKRDHRVALSDAACQMLAGLDRERGNAHVFIGAKPGKGLSNMSMLELLRGMHKARPWLDPKLGQPAVVHGFRASFKTWSMEATHHPEAVIEAALAHIKGDKTEAAYIRGDMLVKRFAAMQDWAAYCSSKPADVIQLPTLGRHL